MVKFGLDAIIYDEELLEIETSDHDAFTHRTIMRASDALTLWKEFTIKQFVSNPANYDARFQETIGSSALRWTDYVNSDPNGDIDRWCTALERSHEVDRRSFTVGLPVDVYNSVKTHPKCRIITSQGLILPANEEHLAEIWGVGAVKILSAKYQTQTEPGNLYSAVFRQLWTNIVVIYRRIEKPTIDAPLAGAIVRRKGCPVVHEPHRDHDRDATIYPVTDKWGLMWRAPASGNTRMFLADRVAA